MGGTFLVVGLVSGALLLVLYAIFGVLGAGSAQTGEVPLWLRSIETGSGVFQATATGLALIVGGLFAYYRFFKEETYSDRLQTGVVATVIRTDETVFLNVAAEAKNTGQVSVALDMELTRVGVSTRKLGVYGWTPRVVDRVFVGQNHVRPDETLRDEVWLEIDKESDVVAVEVELRVARDETLGWLTRNIVSLVEDEGKIILAPQKGEESEG
jgi:hypothetical protein